MLLGGIQGMILCLFLYQKRTINRLAVYFFLLFLFSLSFYNLIYALLDMEFFQYYRPLHMFPYPYKWLIGAGFYFYVKNQFPSKDGKVYHKEEWYLFLPAVLYGLLRTYWFGISVYENSARITRVVVDSDFFRIHEFFYQVFTIAILIASLRLIKKNTQNENGQKKSQPVFGWLRRLTTVFLLIMIIDLILFSFDLFLHNWKESFAFSYPTFMFNTLLIYWIGYMGFTKPKLFFTSIKQYKKNTPPAHWDLLAKKVQKAIGVDKIYTNSNLTLTEFASETGTTTKELSKYINEVHHMNFSEFLNLYRVEEVKELLRSSEANKYTLVTLAEEAGFSSKSSFNAIFKKATGITPSLYKKNQSTL